MALSLANKLGSRGLLAFSVHPGVIATNLGSHMEEADVELLRKCCLFLRPECLEFD